MSGLCTTPLTQWICVGGGVTTEFRISYTASGHDAGIPRRIIFSPRSWLELELRLKEPV